MTENWLPIPSYEGHYEVSDHGRVRSVEREVCSFHRGRWRTCVYKGRVIKQQLRNGYSFVGLSKDGVVQKQYVHRLVLLTFRGEPTKGQEGCHNNNIRTDNRLSNLRWDTHQSNVADCIDSGNFRSIGSYNGDRTECHRGHPFDEANTIIRPEGRSCRKCKLMTERARYHRSKTM